MTATASPQGNSGGDDPSAGGEMTLMEHLRELRNRIFKCFLAVAVGFVAGFLLRDYVLAALQGPYCSLPAEIRAGAAALGDDPEACSLIVLRVLDPLAISIKAAAIVAVVVAAPVVSYQIWRFVTPGLRPVEKRYAIPFLIGSWILFVGGVALAYVVIPRGLVLLLGFAGPGFTPLLGGHEYIDFILFTGIAFGVAFEFPLVLLALILGGVIGSEGLRRYRRQAIFGMFVASAIITPTGDVFTMSALAVPLILFYEGCILVAKLRERRRARRGLSP